MQKNQKSNLNLKLRIYWSYSKIIKKIKQIRFNREKSLINSFIFLAFASIIIGIVIFIKFMIKLSANYTTEGGNILLQETGQVGDFIGGVVGAIWSLTGVLLFYATLRLQSKELSENRKHFQLSRLTDIVYKQLDYFTSHLNNFTLKDLNRDKDGLHLEYKGRAAVTLMRKRVESILEVVKEKEENDNQVIITFVAQNFAFIELNKNEFQNIFEELSNQVNVIRTVLIKDEIPPIELNELKTLFFRNVGDEFLRASELLGKYLDSYIEYKRKQNIEIHEIFSVESIIKSNISVITDFRKKHYDEKTIKDYIENREMYNKSYY